MVIKCFDEPIEIDEYFINDICYIDCIIRERRVILYPEEKIRQAFILYLQKFTDISTENYVIKVEYQNLDIVIYKKYENKDFQPAHNPVLIIELKNECVDISNFEHQLFDYLTLHCCNNGILSNCQQIYFFSKVHNFNKKHIDLCDLEKNLVYNKSNTDINLFESARHGDTDSFIQLILKHGKSNIFNLQCSDFKVPIEVFLLSHSGDFIFFDFCGIKSKRKQPKIKKTSFIKLISVRAL